MSEAHSHLSFEEAVTRLEEIVTAMEGGHLPLDECLRQFQDAVGLSRYCAAKLEAAEKQITLLTAGGEGTVPPDLAWSDGEREPSRPFGASIQQGFDWDA